ncbi:hypothetical protein [Hymenobacter sp. YC55]|uniref:hypothetical protein n=1 Tax=Hymenobacter sp. YC55 TaxID=3034019 RepID=UPI0023F68245|nr:hypothetical protein [Hymenobacter sp. YC55]MDF7814951.1 hypothetical protein [Hymenobacter sp. YC55]
MAAKPKLNLNALVAAPTNPDDLLLTPTPAAPAVQPEPEAVASTSQKIRFTNTLPADIFQQLHQLSFWSREDMSAILEAALTEYFALRPDSQKELPHKEKVKRKLL